MSAITTHVLDTARGRPATGVPVRLEYLSDAPTLLAHGETDASGRVSDLLPDDESLEPGVYRLTFDTATYFRTQSVKGFYPEVTVQFEVRDSGEHYHLPLLISPHGYTTYRGS